MAARQLIALPRIRAIPWIPGYQIGEDGVIWNRRRGWYRVTLRRTSRGYWGTVLHAGGRRITVAVHRLVVEVFLGPCPPGMEVRHLDGNKDNNHLWNLCYGTRSQNRDDSRRHGTLLVGWRNHMAKLTKDQVRTIREMLAEGVYQKDVAAKFGVHIVTIGLIKRRKSHYYDD